jgi:hypothetical protein
LGTRQQHDFHYPASHLKKFQSGVFYMAIKIFNILPLRIKSEFNDSTKFVLLVKNFLCENSFYSLEEFYNFSRMKNL